MPSLRPKTASTYLAAIMVSHDTSAARRKASTHLMSTNEFGVVNLVTCRCTQGHERHNSTILTQAEMPYCAPHRAVQAEIDTVASRHPCARHDCTPDSNEREPNFSAWTFIASSRGPARDRLELLSCATQREPATWMTPPPMTAQVLVVSHHAQGNDSYT